MFKRTIIAALACVGLCLCLSLPALADFNAGYRAYQAKNYRLAMREFMKVPKSNEAQYFIGLMHAKGEGVPQNKQEAAKWFLKSAEQKHVVSQFLLGAMFFTGDGVAQDIPQGVKWVTTSAQNGYAEAQFRLGTMYVNGDQVEKNRKTAVQWLRKAAEKEHPNAVKLLRMMGEDVPAPKKAVRKK